MWYLYDEDYVIIAKSEVEPEESNKVYYDEDLDIDLFKVIVGNIQDINGTPTITYITKKIRSDFELLNMIKEQQDSINNQQVQITELGSTIDYLMSTVIPSLTHLG